MPWRLRRSCHLAQLALQLARPSRPNSVHKRPETARRGPILPFVYTIAIPRPLTTQAHGPTVYTNAPKRLRGAILADLCTLLRPRACPQRRHSPTVYTNAPKRRREAILADLCTLLRPHRTRDRAGPLVPRRRRPHGPVMPGRSDLRPTPPRRWRNHPPIRTHEASQIYVQYKWLFGGSCGLTPR